MPVTAKTLRDRIALLRRLLSKSVDADVTRNYLNEIVMAEMQLRELQRHEKKEKKPREALSRAQAPSGSHDAFAKRYVRPWHDGRNEGGTTGHAVTQAPPYTGGVFLGAHRVPMRGCNERNGKQPCDRLPPELLVQLLLLESVPLAVAVVTMVVVPILHPFVSGIGLVTFAPIVVVYLNA